MGTGFLGKVLKAGSGPRDILINPQIMVGKSLLQPVVPVEEADGGQSQPSLRSAWCGALSSTTHLEIPLSRAFLPDLSSAFAIKVFLMSGTELVSEMLGPLIHVEIF